MTMQRIATFDFGSNSLKLSIFEVVGGRPRLSKELREYCAIGEDVFANGAISEEKGQEVEQAISRLKERLQPDDVILAAATSSFRDAPNGEEMAERFSQTLGAPIPVLKGEDEAALLARGVLMERESTGPAAILDIGGGSVEVIHAEDHTIQKARSYDLGAARLREKFCPTPDDQPHAQEAMRDMAKFIQRKLKHLDPLPETTRLFGSGGGLTTLGGMIHRDNNHSGAVVTADQIQQMLQVLAPITANAIVEQYGMPLKRARIMVAGLMIAWTAMRQMGKSELTVSWAGLREGLAQQYLEQQDSAAAPDNE